MNSDFPRIITLLRKERGISQKSAAQALGVSQALLSHYEKGIRECGLDFLVKTADYYGVSCDYLLGRSPEPEGKTISYDDIPDHDPQRKESFSAGGMMAAFNKKIILNAINVLFSLLQKMGSSALIKSISDFMMIAVYRCFRIIYSANPKNDKNIFTLPEAMAKGYSQAAMIKAETDAAALCSGAEGGVDAEHAPAISATSLTEDYPQFASSMLNLIKNSEATVGNEKH